MKRRGYGQRERRKAFGAGDYAKAETFYDKALKCDPKSLMALTNLGISIVSVRPTHLFEECRVC